MRTSPRGSGMIRRSWHSTFLQDIAHGFARGDSYDRLVRNLQQRFSRVNRRDAYRLIYTEGTYVMAESSIKPFEDDFEQYRISPVLDGKTCSICRGIRD